MFGSFVKGMLADISLVMTGNSPSFQDGVYDCAVDFGADYAPTPVIIPVGTSRALISVLR